jgi:hypothetical protein
LRFFLLLLRQYPKILSSSLKICLSFRVFLNDFPYPKFRFQFQTSCPVWNLHQNLWYVPLLEFFTPLAFLTSKSLLALSLPHLVCSTFRFSQPLSGLLLLDVLGLISYLIHFWGFPFRAFPFQRFDYFSIIGYRLSFSLNDYIPRYTFKT